MRFDYNTMREYASKKEPIGKSIMEYWFFL